MTRSTDGPTGVSGEELPGGATSAPRLGQRVRFTRYDHRCVPPGRTGFIELISDDQFFVATDCGGIFGWTSFASWEPTGEPDVDLSDEFRAMREATRPPPRGDTA